MYKEQNYKDKKMYQDCLTYSNDLDWKIICLNSSPENRAYLAYDC